MSDTIEDKAAAKEKAEKKLSEAGKALPLVQITLGQLDIDETFNSRKAYNDELIEKLAQDILKNGLLNPILVMEAPKGRFKLVSGFTRVKAFQLMEREARKEAGSKTVEPVRIAARVLDKDIDEAEAHVINLSENVLRAELSSFEMAVKAKHIIDTYGWTGAQVGRRLDFGKSHINNMVRALKSLHPDILAAWAENHPMATTSTLFAICKLPDHDAQWMQWLEECGQSEQSEVVEADGEDGEEEDAEDNGKKKSKKSAAVEKVRRPQATHLKAAISAVRKSDKSDDWKEGAIAALKYAAGTAAKMTGVYDPAQVDKTPARKSTRGGAARAEA